MKPDPRWESEVHRLAVEMKLAGYNQGLCDGMPVELLGIGNGRGRKGWKGTISYIAGNDVHVEFDTPGIPEGVYQPNELRPQSRPLCWCARCTWSREHRQ